MGRDIQIENRQASTGELRADIIVRHSKLTAWKTQTDLIPTMIDELPLLAVAATFATGKTIISNASELRVKESDRIACICQGMKALGATLHETQDGFVVEGPQVLHGGIADSYGDHRIAMSLSIAAMNAKGPSTITNVECVDTSFPSFVELVQSLSTSTLYSEKIS